MGEVFWKEDKDPANLRRRADELERETGMIAMADLMRDRADWLERTGGTEPPEPQAAKHSWIQPPALEQNENGT